MPALHEWRKEKCFSSRCRTRRWSATSLLRSRRRTSGSSEASQMKRIQTTHTGSLPRPPDMLEAARARAEGRPLDAPAYEAALRTRVAEIVRKQVEAGID